MLHKSEENSRGAVTSLITILVFLCGFFFTYSCFPDRVNAKAQAITDRYAIYTVKNGDCLSAIAKRFQTSVVELKKLNGLRGDKLQINQVLRVKRLSTTLQKGSQPTRHKTKGGSKVSRGSGDHSLVGELLPWTEANNLFAPGKVATVYDVETGKTLKVKRKGGHFHADVDPAAADDTKTLLQLNNGSWSWNRRAVVVNIGGRMIAASMNGMPHGEKLVANNGFPGHFCIHFLGSQTHGSSYTKSGKPLVDPQHQAMVRKAAGV